MGTDLRPHRRPGGHHQARLTRTAGKSAQFGLLPGDRVELTSLTDGCRAFTLTVGDRGTVSWPTSLAAVHIRQDNGRRIGIIAEELSCLTKTGGHR